MRIKDVRLHLRVNPEFQNVVLYDLGGVAVCHIRWGKYLKRTKRQAIILADRLRDRFNAGQEGK